MAIFHVATNTPPKSEIIADWLGDQPWAPPAGTATKLVGSFHLDDPDGQVGMQGFVVDAGGELLQVALTYRAAPVPELGDALMATMEHSVLGTRYVYDGLQDDRFLMVFAGVALTGYGQALGFAEHQGRWYSVPDEVLLRGSGTLPGRVAVDGLQLHQADDAAVTLRNDVIELVVHRHLGVAPAPPVGLTATWAGRPEPVTLAEVRGL